MASILVWGWAMSGILVRVSELRLLYSVGNPANASIVVT